MVDVGGGAVEDEVAGHQGGSGRQVGAGGVLVLCGAGQAEAGDSVGGLGQSGAVEARLACGRAVSAPQVGAADLGAGVGDRHRGGRSRSVQRTCRRLAAGVVGGGDVQDVGDVGGVVVVGPDGGGQVASVSGAVGAEQAGCGVDGVDRVPGGGRVGAAGRDGAGVGGEGGGFELHGADRSGCRDHVRVAGVVGFGLADGREDRPGQAGAGRGGLLVEGEQAGWDVGERGPAGQQHGGWGAGGDAADHAGQPDGGHHDQEQDAEREAGGRLGRSPHQRWPPAGGKGGTGWSGGGSGVSSVNAGVRCGQ